MEERISERIVEQVLDVPVLQIVEEITKAVSTTEANLGEDFRTERGSLFP